MGLILASGSPQRRKLLRAAGLRFKVVPSRVSESSRERNPRRLVLVLAERKARAVAKTQPRHLVLGADTIVVCRGQILGKPKDPADALRILRRLNGSWQRVYTGVAVAADGGKRLLKTAVVSRVRARKLPDEQLRRLAGKHLDKAGGYAVQDRDDPFIDRVEGPFDNVVGLPVDAVLRLLARAGADRRAA